MVIKIVRKVCVFLHHSPILVFLEKWVAPILRLQSYANEEL